MSDQALTKLLRAPIEYASSAIAASVAVLLLVVPSQFLLVPVMAWAIAAMCLLLALWRFSQGYQLTRYHALLKRIPYWGMSAKEIPWSKNHLFLGRGFEWTQTHTIRLHETLTEHGNRFLRMGWIYLLFRAMERASEHNAPLRPLARLSRIQHWLNPWRPLPPVGGSPELHAVGLYEYDGEHNIRLDLGDRQGHTIVLGTTGVGKTRLAELLITQDIMRGDVVIVLDPKGDADLLLQMYIACALSGRLDKLAVFHLGHPDYSARYNPVGSFERITEVATRISSRLPGEGQSAAFREFVWRYVNNISRAGNALGEQITYNLIQEYAQDIEPLYKRYLEVLLNKKLPNWKEEVSLLDPKKLQTMPKQLKGRNAEFLAMIYIATEADIYDDIASSLHKTWEYDKSYFDKLVASLLPLLEKLVTGSAGQLLSPDYLDTKNPNPIFDWMSVIRTGGVVYVGLDALSDAEVAGVVGSSMMADLTSVAGRIYKHGITPGMPGSNLGKINIQIHADEFNELIQEEFIPMLNKARGAGMNVTAYTQSLADIHARLGTAEKAAQVIDNFNNVFMMRVRSKETAEIVTTQLPEVDVPLQTIISSTSDNPRPETDIDFTSQSQFRVSTQRVPMLDTDALIKLPKGQAVALLAGGKFYKMRLPLAERVDMDLPDNIVSLSEKMRDTYQSVDDWSQLRKGWALPEDMAA